jgi:hypothetical protein
LGISGESTGLVLWRLENGALEGLHPKVAMIIVNCQNSCRFFAKTFAGRGAA